MNLYDFIGTIRSYFAGIISLRMDENNDNNTNRKAITVSAVDNSSAFPPITIYATNMQLTKDDVNTVIARLVEYSKTNDAIRPEGLHKLGLATTKWDDTHPALLPKGYSVITKATGERIIHDEEDWDIGSLDKDASLSEKDALLIDALANELVGGMTSNPPQDSESLVVPPSYFETISTITDNDLQVVEKDLASQGVKPLSSQEKDSHKADRLFALYSAVYDTMSAKGFWDTQYKRLPATGIGKVCRDNGFTFNYINADGKSKDPGYYILDNDKNLIAAGNLLLGDSNNPYYLTDAAVHNLQDQIVKTVLKPSVAATIPKEQSDRITNAESESTSFLAESKGEPDHPGKDPDPTKEKKGPGTGDPNGPGGPGI